MKISARNAHSTVAARRIPAARPASTNQSQRAASQRRRDGTELRFQLLLAALRPLAG